MHGRWEPTEARPDPVEVLEAQAATRVPELVPIRYGRMLTSPFAFYRGAAAVMASDLAVLPRTGIRVQLCGDAHLANFGGFATPERRLVFSLNDFDETLPGPFEWDVKRLATSFAVLARERGVDDLGRRQIVTRAIRQYREAIRDFARMGNLEIWYASLDLEAIVRRWGPDFGARPRRRLERELDRAHTKDSHRALAKLTTVVDGERRIVGDPPLIVPIADFLSGLERSRVEAAARALLRSYRRSLPRDRRLLLERYRYVDAARKVVGVGSVGTRCWIALFVGRDEDDPLFLQFKEAQPSVLEPHLGRSQFANNGQRVVEGQRLMQASSDIMLGWDRISGIDGMTRDFYIRQLWDWKVSPSVDAMSPRALAVYAAMCGWTLARAHARSGDAVAIGAYLGGGDLFDRAITGFAEAYAEQNERDFEALRWAVSSGRVAALSGL